MLWLTWRQFRAQAVAVAALLAIVTITLVITGIQVRNQAAAIGLPGCHAAGDCRRLAANFIYQLRGSPNDLVFNLGVVLLYVVPGLIGLFWGAPLIAREIETGTYRVAWNQSVSRNRWVATKVGLTGLAAIVTAGLLSLLITWWAAPIDRAVVLAGSDSVINLNRLNPLVFGARGIAPIGYAAFALALGAALGVLIRRTLPAMGATLAVFVGIDFAWPNWVRPHLISPAVASPPLGTDINEFLIDGSDKHLTILGIWHRAGAWVLSDRTITPSGRVFTGPATSACLQGTQQQCNAWLASKDLRQLVTFQPASRFWAFQAYDTVIFVLLAVALAVFCAWRVRRSRLA